MIGVPRKTWKMIKRNWSLGPLATANFGLVLAVLVLNSIIVHRNTVALHTAQVSINRTYEVLERSKSLFSALTDAEANARAYAISGDTSSLAAFQRIAATVPNQMGLLHEAVSDNSRQIERANQLNRRVDEQLSRLRSLVETRIKEATDAANVKKLPDNELDVDSIRQIVNELQLEEDRLLNTRANDQQHNLFIVLAANLTAVAVGAAITIVAWYLVERELRMRRSAEGTAQSERQNLWVTLTSIGEGVIVTDRAGRVKLVNPIAQELMGNPAEIIGRSFKDVFSILDETTRTTLENPVSQVLERGKIVGNTGHAVLLRADGSEIPIEQTTAPIRDSSGRIMGVVFVFRDCSERRRFDREMNEREQRFRRVFETPLIGIAVGSARGNILEANEAFLELIGYQGEEFLEAELSWEGIPQGQSPLGDAAKRELREKGSCRPFERTYVRADGTAVPVLISAARLLDEQDRIVIFVTDLSQSKRAEAALRDSEARFRILSECMPQKVWTARPDGQLDYVNHMLLEYSGLSSEQLMGRGWTILVHPEDISGQLAAWKRSLSTGDMFEIEHRVRKHTGEYRWHLARALPLYNPDSQITMWVGTNTDIHDQKLAEETLREEHHRKDQFLALLAHELRNPLAPLSNAIQVFPTVQNDPASSAALLGIMQRQVGQMTRLIDDLLDLSRITTGRMRLRRERVAVNAIVAAAVEAVQPLISEREHKLVVSVPQQQLWLDADSARIIQILTNLLHNAAKYTEPHGRLTLTVEQSGAEAVFRMRDNGQGMPKEMLTKIFDLFTQLESTHDRGHGGLGIGLTLVRTLVELHDGSVTASSDGLGQGSEFVVRLPMKEPPLPATDSTENVQEPNSPPLPVLRVLVVDDVQASANTLALMLKALGQNVEVAFDGPSAIARATETLFDVIFLDIAMPGMDGLEVARRLREIRDLNSLMLIALTGFGQVEDREHSIQAGFNEHLTKPTSLDVLKEVLHRAFEMADHSPIHRCQKPGEC